MYVVALIAILTDVRGSTLLVSEFIRCWKFEVAPPVFERILLVTISTRQIHSRLAEIAGQTKHLANMQGALIWSSYLPKAKPCSTGCHFIQRCNVSNPRIRGTCLMEPCLGNIDNSVCFVRDRCALLYTNHYIPSEIIILKEGFPEFWRTCGLASHVVDA